MKPRTRAKKLMDASYTDLMKRRHGKKLKARSPLVEFSYWHGGFRLSTKAFDAMLNSWREVY